MPPKTEMFEKIAIILFLAKYTCYRCRATAATFHAPSETSCCPLHVVSTTEMVAATGDDRQTTRHGGEGAREPTALRKRSCQYGTAALVSFSVDASLRHAVSGSLNFMSVRAEAPGEHYVKFSPKP